MIRAHVLLWFCAIPLLGQVSPEALIHDGHFKRARVAVEAMYQAKPNDPQTLWLMSQVRLVWKDFKAAHEFAEKALAADPKNAKYHLQLAEVIGEELDGAGKLKQMSMAHQFKKEVDTALALDANNTQAMNNLIEYYFHAPGILGGDKAKAHALADRVIGIDPVEGAFSQIRIARLEKHDDQIEGILKKAVEARPGSYEAHVQLGNLYFGSKNSAGAEAQAREAIRIDATRAGGHSLLAAALGDQAKWAELDAALAAGEKAVPDNLLAYFRAGNICLAKGTELERGERYFRMYLSQEPEPNIPTLARAHWRLGLLLERAGRKPDAIAELQTANKIEPSLPAKNDLKRLQ